MKIYSTKAFNTVVDEITSEAVHKGYQAGLEAGRSMLGEDVLKELKAKDLSDFVNNEELQFGYNHAVAVASAVITRSKF